MFRIHSNLVADEVGAVAIEYGLIPGLFSVAAIVTMEALGVSLSVAAIVTMEALGMSLVGMFYTISSGIDTAVLAANGN